MDADRRGQRRPPRRRWIRNSAIVLALIVLCVAARLVSANYISGLMQPYISFSNDPFIAQLYVTKTNTNHEWIVHISISDRSGKLIARTNSNPLPCDKWELRADVISIKSWLAGILGVPSEGYRITDINGTDCYSQGNVDASLSKNIQIDASATELTQSWVYGKLITSTSLTSNSIGPDGKIYEAFITPTSLSLTPTN